MTTTTFYEPILSTKVSFKPQLKSDDMCWNHNSWNLNSRWTQRFKSLFSSGMPLCHILACRIMKTSYPDKGSSMYLMTILIHNAETINKISFSYVSLLFLCATPMCLLLVYSLTIYCHEVTKKCCVWKAELFLYFCMIQFFQL